MEIDALLGAVVELGRLVQKPMPLCEAILVLLRERARRAQLYPD
jgi:2-dehydropantoate 2-reductase